MSSYKNLYKKKINNELYLSMVRSKKDKSIKMVNCKSMADVGEWGETHQESFSPKKQVKPPSSKKSERVKTPPKEIKPKISRRSQIMLQRHSKGVEIKRQATPKREPTPKKEIIEEKPIEVPVYNIPTEPAENTMEPSFFEFKEEEQAVNQRFMALTLTDANWKLKNYLGTEDQSRSMRRSINESLIQIERSSRLTRDKLEIDASIYKENMSFITQMPQNSRKSVKLPKINSRYSEQEEKTEEAELTRKSTHSKLKQIAKDKLSASLKRSKTFAREKNKEIYDRLEQSNQFYKVMAEKINKDVENLTFYQEEELI